MSTTKEGTGAAVEPPAGVCACAAEAASGTGGRKAVGVDPEIKRSTLNRLRRIEGQVRGLQRMVEEERYCADVMMQVASVREALRATSRELLRNHLEYCATAAIRKGDEEAREMYDELVDLMYRHAR